MAAESDEEALSSADEGERAADLEKSWFLLTEAKFSHLLEQQADVAPSQSQLLTNLTDLVFENTKLQLEAKAELVRSTLVDLNAKINGERRQLEQQGRSARPTTAPEGCFISAESATTYVGLDNLGRLALQLSLSLNSWTQLFARYSHSKLLAGYADLLLQQRSVSVERFLPSLTKCQQSLFSLYRTLVKLLLDRSDLPGEVTGADISRLFRSLTELNLAVRSAGAFHPTEKFEPVLLEKLVEDCATLETVGLLTYVGCDQQPQGPKPNNTFDWEGLLTFLRFYGAANFNCDASRIQQQQQQEEKKTLRSEEATSDYFGSNSTASGSSRSSAAVVPVADGGGGDDTLRRRLTVRLEARYSLLSLMVDESSRCSALLSGRAVRAAGDSKARRVRWLDNRTRRLLRRLWKAFVGRLWRRLQVDLADRCVAESLWDFGRLKALADLALPLLNSCAFLPPCSATGENCTKGSVLHNPAQFGGKPRRFDKKQTILSSVVRDIEEGDNRCSSTENIKNCVVRLQQLNLAEDSYSLLTSRLSQTFVQQVQRGIKQSIEHFQFSDYLMWRYIHSHVDGLPNPMEEIDTSSYDAVLVSKVKECVQKIIQNHFAQAAYAVQVERSTEISHYVCILTSTFTSEVEEAVGLLAPDDKEDFLNRVLTVLVRDWASYLVEHNVQFSRAGAKQLDHEIEHLERSVIDCFSPPAELMETVGAFKNIAQFLQLPKLRSRGCWSLGRRNKVFAAQETADVLTNRLLWDELKVTVPRGWSCLCFR